MQALQAIADANPGAGRPSVAQLRRAGLQASVDYVADAMRKPIRRHHQPYTFTYSSFVGTPNFSEVSPTPRGFTLNQRVEPG